MPSSAGDTTSDSGPAATGSTDADTTSTTVSPADVAAEVESAITAVQAGLPTDVRAAARSLVDTVRNADDETTAVGATAELLRRAGFPLVDADGAVVALPDDAAFSDMPLYVELVGNITRSVRAGDLYPVASVGQLLYDLETVDGPLPWQQLAFTVGGWGKSDAPGDEPPPFIASAAATIRALSGLRGDVFVMTEPEAAQGLDALQLMILVGHAGGVPVPVPGTEAFSLARHVTPAGHASDSPRREASCESLQKALSGDGASQLEQLGLSTAKWGWGKAVDHSLDYLTELAKLPGSDLTDLRLVKSVKGGLKAYDVVNKAASYAALVVLLLGTTLELSTDKLATHYKHADGTTAEEVWAAAYAEFNSSLSQARLACYGLAGLTVPKNGPMSGINVKWSLGQELRPSSGSGLAAGADLRPTKDSIPKFTLDTTNADGIAEVHLKPPVEDETVDRSGPELKSAATLTAHLEKGELPFSLSDLLAVLELNPAGAAIAKTIDALKSIAVDELLPTASVKIGVTYHGAAPVIVKVDNSVNLFLYSIPRVYADLVSCSGLAGPYTGTGGYSTVGIDVGGLIHNAGAGALGLPQLPQSSPAQDVPLSIFANPPGAAPARFLIASGDGGQPFIEGELEIDASAATSSTTAFGWVSYDVGDGRLGQRVGSLELLLAGNPWPFSDLTGTAYRVASDPRCPAAEVHWDDN